MDIVGGVYREICQLPPWDQWYGSGGRAAAVVAALGGKPTLHTYASDLATEAVQRLERSGVRVLSKSSASRVAFAYLYPLSRPGLATFGTENLAPITIQAPVVLRFGMVESEAVVDGDRVVYDPQTMGWPSFSLNGSRARELALVLNEAELSTSTRQGSNVRSPAALMSAEGASVAVIKRGIHGADVYENSNYVGHVDAYKTSRVFKIGSGDVFSASFAHFWAERNLSPLSAADQASRAVAQYVSTANVASVASFDSDKATPATTIAKKVAVYCKGSSLPAKWMTSEAEFFFHDVGIEVAPSGAVVDATLVLADFGHAGSLPPTSGSVIELSESTYPNTGLHGHKTKAVTDDFCTALYWTAWRGPA